MKRLACFLALTAACSFSVPAFAGWNQSPTRGWTSPKAGQSSWSSQIQQSGQDAGQGGTFQPITGEGDPSEATASLLSLVVSDLQLFRSTLRTNGFYRHNVSAIGYLNNARSALSRASFDAAWLPLVREIHDRIGRAKFHLVMNDTRNADLMIAELIGIIQTSLLGGTQSGFVQTGTTAFLPNVPTYTGPVTGSIPNNYSPWNWFSGSGQGQNIQPSLPWTPNGWVRVSW